MISVFKILFDIQNGIYLFFCLNKSIFMIIEYCIKLCGAQTDRNKLVAYFWICNAIQPFITSALQKVAPERCQRVQTVGQLHQALLYQNGIVQEITKIVTVII